MTYDELGRLTAKYESDIESHWVYDTAPNGIGQLAEAYTGPAALKDYHRVHIYDSLGRLNVTEETLTDAIYRSTVGYDIWGRVVAKMLRRGTAAPKIFGLRYDITGSVSRVERGDLVLWRAVRNDAARRVVEVALGNGLTQTRSYNEYSARISNSELKTANGQLRLTEGYQYDPVGNVTHRSQYWDESGFQDDFTYDALNRLKSAEMLSQPKQIFDYDDAGNITSKTGVGTGSYVYPSQGATAVRPHAVASIPGIGIFAYDENGNLTSGAGGWLD